MLELPHELYLPIEPLLERLARRQMVGILSHPERNEGVLRRPDVLPPLVDAGCLMQVTAGSVCGTFGPACRQLAEWILAEGLVHFIATDAHGSRSRRPMMRRAFVRVAELTDKATATDLCCRHPELVARGQAVMPGRRTMPRSKRSWWRRTVA
jgi:protein-tyrosine phosphatase